MNPRKLVRPTMCAAMALVIAGASAEVWAAVIFTPIALTGTDGPLGPGQGPGVQFFGIGGAVPTINQAGRVAFRGQNTAAGNPNGVWRRAGGVNTNVALSGTPQPGGGTYPNVGFNTPMINNAGQLAWRSGTNSLFSNTGGTPGLVMKTTDVAPGTGGATYSSLATPSPFFNGAGQTGYVANLAVNSGSPPVVLSGPTANSSGVWIGTPGAMNLALRQNDAVTAIDAGGSVRVGAMSAAGFAMNGAGHYSAVATLQGTVTTGVTSGNDQAILTNRNGSLEVIARRGDQAVGAATGEFYRSLTNGGMNNNNHVVFASSLRNAAGTQVAAGALFSDVTGSMTMHARAGNPMPSIDGATGTEFDGVNWGSNFGTTPLINSEDTLVFAASGLSGTGVSIGLNDAGIFTMDSTGEFGKVMRTGDVAPVGLAIDATPIKFGGLQGGLAVNSLGQVAFSTLLSGFNVNGGIGNNLALFATDLEGTIHTIARRQSPFEVAPGDIRTVSAISGALTGAGEDGRQVMFNNRGQLVFSLDFTDGSSGVFIADVPEPATVVLMGLGCVALLRRQRAD